jgi:hypothetical protein
LGATLYFLLTGVAPFGGGDVLTTLMQVIEHQPQAPRKFNRAVDRYLQAICLKCLEKDPADRYPSAQALADDLGRYLRDEPTVALAPPLVIRFSKWCRRNPAVARLTIVILLILLGTSGVMSTLYLQLRVVHGSVTYLEDEKKLLQDDKQRLDSELVGLTQQAEESLTVAKNSAKDAAASEAAAAKSLMLAEKAESTLAQTNSTLVQTEKELKEAQKGLEPLLAMLVDSNRKLEKQTADLAVAEKEVAASNTKLKANQLALATGKKQLALAKAAERKQLKLTAAGQRELGKTHSKLDENEEAKGAFSKSILASRLWLNNTRENAPEHTNALLSVAESCRLLGDLHVNLEELGEANENYRASGQAIAELQKRGLNGEPVQFSNAQLLNSRSIVFETDGLLDEQLELLQSARTVYVALIASADKANKIRYRRKLARTDYNLGRAYDRHCSQGKSDNWQQVVSSFDKAVSGLESLRADAGQDRELELAVIQELAQALQERSSGWLGFADASTGNTAVMHEKQAIKDADASIALCQVLVEKSPRNPQYKVDRIYARMTRATLFPPDQTGNTAAEKLYLGGIASLEAIVEEHQIPAHRSLLGDARTNLGVLYQDWQPTRLAPARKRLAQAEQQYVAALKEAERLHAQFKGLALYRVALARALLNVADLIRDRDRAGAAKMGQRGLELIKPLRARFPGRRDYRELEGDLKKLSR